MKMRSQYGFVFFADKRLLKGCRSKDGVRVKGTELMLQQLKPGRILFEGVMVCLWKLPKEAMRFGLH